mmetsp:Transcript_27016/g.70969  ORF Transcript_27016/g.70969 Transcript_27016/m.70969 type:complete len:142 (-) Transcript_27016:343-768(-)|eukprot:CAMPEP_0182916512 /NCGR_PEP_ID=MMETSP0105_2-20130417/985_1 /TAXON_ID=81532 ORGANISM="Acanthoeca-like sp., Strain 10tr" /NCGR_SAMPLE_ID=MMETSP0105_2 /ASSEMBLY_ACC=CAM_ASM_000205 /LENGTH=141 /DNA_ID=CAMNT_0025053471 /DNA_START=110 /DNA_END=535 /DNA_ORIENTATION=+
MAAAASAQSLIKRVAHVGIRVHSLARSRAFYSKLGFEFVVGPVGPEPVAIMKHPAGVEVNFILNANVAEAPNVLMDVADKHAGITHVALEVTNVDAMVEVLKAEDIPLSGGPNEYPKGARGCFIRDPDRNTIEFYQPAPKL